MCKGAAAASLLDEFAGQRNRLGENVCRVQSLARRMIRLHPHSEARGANTDGGEFHQIDEETARESFATRQACKRGVSNQHGHNCGGFTKASQFVRSDGCAQRSYCWHEVGASRLSFGMPHNAECLSHRGNLNGRHGVGKRICSAECLDECMRTGVACGNNPAV